VYRVGVEGARWAEIDYHEDLAKARALVASLKEPARAARSWSRSDGTGSHEEPALREALPAGSDR
jgi:hypothetical protein